MSFPSPIDAQTITADDVSQVMEGCFPIEQTVYIAEFWHPSEFILKRLDAKTCAHWNKETLRYEVQTTYTATAQNKSMQTSATTESLREAVKEYNSNDVSALTPATLINRCFDLLGIGTDAHPYSGLMAEDEPGSESVVKIFNDYDSGRYYADQVWAVLESHQAIGLSLSEVWDAIRPAEA